MSASILGYWRDSIPIWEDLSSFGFLSNHQMTDDISCVISVVLAARLLMWVMLCEVTLGVAFLTTQLPDLRLVTFYK